jgi:hypothetical protein
MEKGKIYKNAEEYGALHNEDCCVNDENNGCDFDVKPAECCKNMRMVKSIIDETIADTVEFLSHDMNFRDEEQRKSAVKLYLGN